MAKILAVDDSSTIRKLVKFTLQMRNHEVILSEDGIEALENFENYNFDILVTDLNMPKMNGIELIKNIRAGAKNNDIPIILLTTESENKDKEMGLKAGADSYMIKPFQPPQLLDEIDKYIKK